MDIRWAILKVRFWPASDCSPATPPSDLSLLRRLQYIVDLNAEVANGAFQFRMSEQKLHRPGIPGSPVDQVKPLSAAWCACRMPRRQGRWMRPSDEPREHIAGSKDGARRAADSETGSLLASALAPRSTLRTAPSLLCDFELNWSLRLLLHDDCPGADL